MTILSNPDSINVGWGLQTGIFTRIPTESQCADRFYNHCLKGIKPFQNLYRGIILRTKSIINNFSKALSKPRNTCSKNITLNLNYHLVKDFTPPPSLFRENKWRGHVKTLEKFAKIAWGNPLNPGSFMLASKPNLCRGTDTQVIW